MKRFLLLTVFCCVVCGIAAQQAVCQTTGKGIGIVIGEPTGISGKMWINRDIAVSGAAAWSFSREEYIHIHADWVRHNWSILTDKANFASGGMPVYYGIGGRIKVEDDTRVGIRFVLGYSYIVENAPYDVFIEIAPIMDVIPETDLTANACIGVRYWF